MKYLVFFVNTKVRIAICFWGMCRTTDWTIESIKQFLYKPLKDAEIPFDVYVHALTLDAEYSHSRNSEQGHVHKDLCYLLEPTQLIREDQNVVDCTLDLEAYRSLGDPWETLISSDGKGQVSKNFECLNNHVRALYSLHKVTKMALQEQYTTIIFSRPDVKFLNPLDVNWLCLGENSLHLPDFHEYPINDRFAIASPKAAATYGLRYTNAKDYSLTKPLHTESYLQDCLRKDGCTITKIHFRFRRIRVPCIERDLDVKAPYP
jgi:hypothetical protein